MLLNLINPSTVRHEYTSILFATGVDEKVAQELQGHADILTTRNIYQHLKQTQKEEARKKLSEYLE